VAAKISRFIVRTEMMVMRRPKYIMTIHISIRRRLAPNQSGEFG
jgi:hypothetical protein